MMRSMRLTALGLALIVLSFGTAWAIPITLNPAVDVYWLTIRNDLSN